MRTRSCASSLIRAAPHEGRGAIGCTVALWRPHLAESPQYSEYSRRREIRGVRAHPALAQAATGGRPGLNTASTRFTLSTDPSPGSGNARLKLNPRHPFRLQDGKPLLLRVAMPKRIVHVMASEKLDVMGLRFAAAQASLQDAQ
jgi:hypothetical protein